MSDTPVFSQFDRLAPLVERLAANPATGLHRAALRRQSLERAVRLGFPTTRNEEWKYTSLEPLAGLPFLVRAGAPAVLPDAARLAPFFLGGNDARRLVFVDGVFAPSLSQLGAPQPGLSVGSLAQAEGTLLDRVDHCAGAYENPMGALNTAFFEDGACVFVAAGVVVPEPIQVLMVNTRPDAGSVQHLRHLIVAEANSQATIVETYASLAEAAYVTNALTEAVIAEGARIEHVRLQTEGAQAFHFGAVHAHLERSSVFHSHAFALGARLARNDLRVVFRGEGGYALLNGLYLADGEQLVDHHTVVDHAQPHCESHEYYNGILDGSGRGVFNGKIFVREDAQKTDAKQTNRNLLLSPNASIDTKPQLEIFADDVKCTHGATVGQLDEDCLFYLRARGIGLEEARRMLIHAFAAVAIQRVPSETLQTALDALVLAKLRGGKDEHD